MKSVDILVPSFRLDAGPLLAILDIEPPADTTVRWIIIVDNPAASIPEAVAARVDGTRVQMIRNPRNLGSAGARNAALDASSAEWVLFLDDDVTPCPDLLAAYRKEVESNPDAAGFFGPTDFQRAATQYQRGVEISDILTFFRIANDGVTLPWAPTSNVLVRGDAARTERFRTLFPKGGGGEDIDYLLRVTERAGGTLLGVPEAKVMHPWWFEGARDYTRFMRWSFGDSLLHQLHPRHTYRSAPNAVEFLVLGLPIAFGHALVTGSVASLLAVVLGIIAGELLAEFARLALLKGFPASLYCVETVAIRSANDIGRVAMQLFKLRRLRGMTERWDHFCDGKHVPYHRRWALLKAVAHATGVASAGWVLLW